MDVINRTTSVDQKELDEALSYLACVKWFNTKAGYGFVTVIDDGELKGKDLFTHHTTISTENTMYKYLVKGEYVSILVSNESGNVIKVGGVKWGKVMCEVRGEMREDMKRRSVGSKGLELGEGECEGV
jgi:cold shock CspA family protein